MKRIELSKNIIVIEDFWSSTTCDEFIEKSEAIGYEAAYVQTDLGPRIVGHARNNDRVMWQDIDFANELWQQAKAYVPAQVGESVAVGFNELFRFYRYEPGQQFRKHQDQSFVRNDEEASYYTFMIYLNDNFKGGETRFNDIVVSPKNGSALMFYHFLDHEGSEVTEGKKYVLRTDIMYSIKKHE